jgi:hypothetical protein
LLAEDVGGRLGHAHRLTEGRVRRGVVHQVGTQRAVGAAGGRVLRGRAVTLRTTDVVGFDGGVPIRAVPNPWFSVGEL